MAIEYSERLANEDLLPTKEKKWGIYNLFAVWMSDVHSVGGYTFAAGLFFLGLAGWQVFLALTVGIVIVFFFTNLLAVPGQRYGIPYPVMCRIGFGVFGANIAALIRAVIAIAWYGIQTWLASVAVVILALRIFPGLTPLTEGSFLGLSYLGWLCFLALWLVQFLVFYRGIESVRRFIDWAGPAVYVVMFLLAIWILTASGWHIDFNLRPAELSAGQIALQFVTAVSLVVAYFSTLILNFCDFTRFASSKRAVIHGNFWGLPVNFMLFSLVTVVITAGTVPVFGEAIVDPVQVVAKIPNTFALAVGAIVLAVATIGINIVANFVSPAYDLANVAPKYIDFRRGGLISAVLSVLVMPWHLYNSPVAINYFLGGLGAFLGPLFGVIVADLYLVKRGRVDTDALYREGEASPYWYEGGVNRRAVAAFIPAAAIAAIIALVPALHVLSAFSWFIGAALGALFYMAVAPKAALPFSSGVEEVSAGE